MLYALSENRPQIHKDCFIAPSASVIGQVQLAEQVSVWFNAVIRADNDSVTIGSQSNIQDGAVLHVDPGVPIRVGERVTIGHKAMIHGCTIGNDSLIGMNAVVLNNAVIGSHCLIGANTLITEGAEIPDGSMVLGSPGRVVKPVSEAAREMMLAAAQSYVEKIALYQSGLKPI